MMRTAMLFALVIAVLVLALVYTEYNQYKQIGDLRDEQNEMADDLLRLKQEFAKEWHSGHGESAKSEWPKYHDATGVVLYTSQNRIVVDEDEIPGFMRAMVMSYEVENPEQLKGLQEGDKVKLRLKETEDTLTVVEVKK